MAPVGGRYAAYVRSESRPYSWSETEPVTARSAREALQIVSIREWVIPSRVRVLRIGTNLATLLRKHKLILTTGSPS